MRVIKCLVFLNLLQISRILNTLIKTQLLMENAHPYTWIFFTHMYKVLGHNHWTSSFVTFTNTNYLLNFRSIKDSLLLHSSFLNSILIRFQRISSLNQLYRIDHNTAIRLLSFWAIHSRATRYAECFKCICKEHTDASGFYYLVFSVTQAISSGNNSLFPHLQITCLDCSFYTYQIGI